MIRDSGLLFLGATLYIFSSCVCTKTTPGITAISGNNLISVVAMLTLAERICR